MADLVFVRLELLGSLIANRVPDSALHAIKHNRTRAEADSLIEAGMPWLNTPREVAEAVDITIRMVSDTAALSSIAHELSS